MKPHASLKPFNLDRWIADNAHLLQPPVGNRLLHDEQGMIVMVIGGPNTRSDFHDDPVQEWFYQLRGDMLLKIAEGGEFHDVVLREGDVFLLPPHTRHSPQRPQAGSVGLVVEAPRMSGMKDGFEWFCFDCGRLLHRAEVALMHPAAIVETLPGVFDAFHDDTAARSCGHCGALHPGRGKPPPGWAAL